MTAKHSLETVEDLIADVLGMWCSRCKKITQPYIGEGRPLGYGAYEGVWPCCNGCWQEYPDAEA
jgi:hypothetical protein